MGDQIESWLPIRDVDDDDDDDDQDWQRKNRGNWINLSDNGDGGEETREDKGTPDSRCRDTQKALLKPLCSQDVCRPGPRETEVTLVWLQSSEKMKNLPNCLQLLTSQGGHCGRCPPV